MFDDGSLSGKNMSGSFPSVWLEHCRAAGTIRGGIEFDWLAVHLVPP